MAKPDKKKDLFKKNQTLLERIVKMHYNMLQELPLMLEN